MGLAVPASLILLVGGVAYKSLDGSAGLPNLERLRTAFTPARSGAATSDVAPALPIPTQAAAPTVDSAPAVPAQATLPPPVPHQMTVLQQPAPLKSQPPPQPAPAQAVTAVPPKKVLLSLAGSDVIAGKLARRIASSYLTLIGDSEVGLLPGEAARSVEIGGMQTGQLETVVITSGSSASGFVALLRGSADMAMSARKILPAEQERLSSLGDLTAPTSEIVVGLVGVAAIINPVNRISDLTIPQLRSILAGRLADWSQVGGAPGPIHVYVVDGQGGMADVPHEVLMSQDEVLDGATRLPSEQAVADSVASDQAGIGFTALGAAGTTKVLAVAENGASPVVPSDLSISTEKYPLSRRLYLYAMPGFSNLFVKRFSAYVSSVGGQAVVEAAGVVPLTVRAEKEAVPDAAPERFRQLVAGTTQLSVSFRFQPGSMNLDSRGLRDLERLTAYLKVQRINPSRVILAGFADNYGTPAVNQVVSQRRVEAVVAALTKAGLAPGKMATFGAELPLADNSTPEGRERNRRVEVYLAEQ